MIDGNDVSFARIQFIGLLLFSSTLNVFITGKTGFFKESKIDDKHLSQINKPMLLMYSGAH